MNYVSSTYSIHFNIITAELLVNGVPLARLPSEYTTHPSYSALFQGFLLEVGPTNEPGMEFSSKLPFRGYTIHLGKDGDDLLVAAIGQGRQYVAYFCAIYRIKTD